jgi:ferrochelatase
MTTVDTTHHPSAHPKVNYGKVGVLLVNLGTPDGTDYTSMRRYLKEFLTDKRVIEWSPWKWYPILFGIVLNTRPGKVGKAYLDGICSSLPTVRWRGVGLPLASEIFFQSVPSP